MDKNKQYKIALVIKTNLEYDDRVRKEVLTIQNLFPNIKFKLFPLYDDNRLEEGVCSYGVPYKTVHLKTRETSAKSSHLFLKALDFYKSVKNDIKDYDAIWCADPETCMIVLLARCHNIVWDLHELPTAFLGNFVMKYFLKFLFSKCNVIVHANQARIDYLESKGVVKNKSKHYFLRNYPNFGDVSSEFDSAFYSFMEWKKGRKCIYLQGLNGEGRCAYESICAVLNLPELCAVVVGNFDQKIKTKLLSEYNDLEERIRFIGKIEQQKTPQYIKESIMSIVLYKNIGPNNWYCEANRCYQSIIMGIPVVVGNNPTMKTLIDKYGFGICIDSDGSDINKITKGLSSVIDNYDWYLENNNYYRSQILWDNQNPIIINIIKDLFKSNNSSM